MDLNERILELWCRYNSKGKWTTKEGRTYYIEELEDNHLMRLPFYLKKKFYLDSVSQLPTHIIEEIKERDMIIDKDTFYVTKKSIPKDKIEKTKENIIKQKPKVNRNKKLFNKLRR